MLEAERLSAGPEKGFFLGGSFEDWRKNLIKNKKVGKRLSRVYIYPPNKI